MENQKTVSKFQSARRRVENLKKFYTHLTIYLVINSVITGLKVHNNLNNWENLTDDLFSFNTLSTWVVWGLILLIHAFSVFILPKLLGYDWEERKIEQLMREESKASK